MSTKLVCISDTHCQLNKVELPDGDILIHAGDALSRGTHTEFTTFINRMEKLNRNYEHTIYVPGNHDIVTEKNEALVKDECSKRGIIYLNDSGISLKGLNFWGSAVTPRFHNWAWNRDSNDSGTSYSDINPKYNPIQSHWDLIPTNTDILITHGPPKGYLDVSVYNGDNCGCRKLLDKVLEIKPQYHIFGHIHHWGGLIEEFNGVKFANVSICTEQYKPLNKPTVIEIN